MKFKPNWPEAQARLTALWQGKKLDRPCISVTAPADSPNLPTAPPMPENPQDRWLNPDWVLPHLRQSIQGNCWLGEAIPSYLLMAGWVFCYGARPGFSPHTIWHQPEAVDFSMPPNFQEDWDDPLCQDYLELYSRVLEEAGKDNFLLGRPCLLPGNDLLAARMGTQDFLTALADEPEWMEQAIRQIAEAQIRVADRFAALAQERGHQYWYGNAGWMPFWAPEPYMSTQSDVSCMISPQMFQRFVVPELDALGSNGPIWYHLDGGDARQHLDTLLSLPYLKVIQYVPAPFEAENGPEHAAFYRRIQERGRIVHVQVRFDLVLELLKQVDPHRICILTGAPSKKAAEELLKQAAHLC